MKPFNGKADDNRENALRRGFSVPEGAVNIAWVKSPSVSPKNNIVVVDTSRVVKQNLDSDTKNKRLAYANSLGILESEDGNELWADEYLTISDKFLADGEFNEDEILPYLHSSRYFHLDKSGMGTPGDVFEYTSKSIKVIDDTGQEYTSESGKPLYRVFLQQVPATVSTTSDDGVYRVLVYLDVDRDRDDLYLMYQKCELSTTGAITSREYSFKEIVNPRPYFCYVPEETDVIDHSSLGKKIYSSKPVGMKEKLLHLSENNQTGWRIFVPRKAISDPRVFQTFQWRLKTEYVKPVTVDPTRNPRQVRCGVIVTSSNEEPSTAAWVFYNLMNSDYNYGKATYVNPLRSDHSKANKLNPSYWAVNFDTVTNEELSKFDILVWAANSTVINLHKSAANYLAKIRYYVENIGGTLLIDTANTGHIAGLGIKVTGPVNGESGLYKAVEDGDEDRATLQGSKVSHSNASVCAVGNTITYQSLDNRFLKGETKYGGWNIDSGADGLNTISPYKQDVKGFKYLHYIKTYPDDFTILLRAYTSHATPQDVPVAIHKQYPSGGQLIFSSMGIARSCSNIFDSSSPNRLVAANIKRAFNNDKNNTFALKYENGVNSAFIEGAMKLMVNICMEAMMHKSVDDNDEEVYETSYIKYTNWYPSWVIDAGDDVLSAEEKTKYQFAMLPSDTDGLESTWQRTLSAKTLLQLSNAVLTPNQRISVAGATRTYTIQTTNPHVETKAPADLVDADLPRAWTTAYTPKFIVPDNFGSYVIRDEEIKAEYSPGTFVSKAYPAKPFDFRISANYVSGYQNGDVLRDVTVEFFGTAKKLVTTTVPPTTETTVVDIDLDWKNYGSNDYEASTYTGQSGIQRPIGIRTWQEINYSGSGMGASILNWPYWGMDRRISKAQDSKGKPVSFLKDVLNKFADHNLYSPTVETMKVDGTFSQRLHTAVIDFQTQMGLRRKDGVVDTETWSAIGFGIIKLTETLGNIERWTDYGKHEWAEYYALPAKYLKLDNVSDGNLRSSYMKASAMSDDTPAARISDAFKIKLSDTYKVFGATLIPEVLGSTEKTMTWDWLHFGEFNLSNFNVNKMNPGLVRQTVRDGVAKKLVVNPIMGIDTIGFGIAQSKPSGIGDSKIMGIREFIVHAKKKNTVVIDPGGTTTQEYLVDVKATYTINVVAGRIKSITPVVMEITDTKNPDRRGRISDVQWYKVSASPYEDDFTPKYHHPDGRVTELLFDTNYRNAGTDHRGFPAGGQFSFQIKDTALDDGDNVTYGSRIGRTASTSYRLMTPAGDVVPYARTDGYISMHEGLKLVCDASGKPIGFPAFSMAQATNTNGDVHFMNITINHSGTSKAVKLGFYDKARREFIETRNNIDELPYAEYMSRGRDNIYVAVLCELERNIREELPDILDAPKLPSKWAMPVYGVTDDSDSHIHIEGFSPDLNKTDIWPIPIKVGRFVKRIKLRNRENGPLADRFTGSEGTTITAVYSIPEAKSVVWSALYGRPYQDVESETPVVLDDDMIQVRQYPVLMVQDKTVTGLEESDPWRLVAKVYKRATIDSAWEEIAYSDIKDFSAANGTIILRENLYSNDSRLVKVSYTSAKGVLHLKHDGTNRINMNPFINAKPEWLNKPLYVCLFPEYFIDETKTVSTSKRTRTLQVLEDNSIFNPNQGNYDPSAVLLGVIYITTSMDVDDLVILDTRKRGGGAQAGFNDKQVEELQKESTSYWDIEPSDVSSYPNGGFVIIRLPAELKDNENITDQEIIQAIERNLTAGIGYKVEDLDGNKW